MFSQQKHSQNEKDAEFQQMISINQIKIIFHQYHFSKVVQTSLNCRVEHVEHTVGTARALSRFSTK